MRYGCLGELAGAYTALDGEGGHHWVYFLSVKISPIWLMGTTPPQRDFQGPESEQRNALLLASVMPIVSQRARIAPVSRLRNA